MDKYQRNDDMNDEQDPHNHNEDLDRLTITQSHNGNQPLKVFGRTRPERDVMNRVTKARAKLSSQEQRLLTLIVNRGKSISAAAKSMNISQPMASKYWKRIKEKMKND